MVYNMNRNVITKEALWEIERKKETRIEAETDKNDMIARRTAYLITRQIIEMGYSLRMKNICYLEIVRYLIERLYTSLKQIPTFLHIQIWISNERLRGK